MLASTSETIMPGAEKTMMRRRPIGSTILSAMTVQRKLTAVMMRPTAVALSKPTALKSVAL